MSKDSRREAESAYRADPSAFFEDLLRERDDDRSLIDPSWSAMDARYHYNVVENAVMDWLHSQQFDPSALNVLDIGVGNGHWVRFYRDVVGVRRVHGIDFAPTAIERLGEECRRDPRVSLAVDDITHPRTITGRYDVINAIGVLFHIVDDDKWREALRAIVAACREDTSVIVGGDFGAETRMRGVMRRSRSLEMWREELCGLGMAILQLRRFDWHRGADAGGITDNILVFGRTDSSSDA